MSYESTWCVCPHTATVAPSNAPFRTARDVDTRRRKRVVDAVEYTFTEATVSTPCALTYTLPGGTTARVFDGQAEALARAVGLLPRMAS